MDWDFSSNETVDEDTLNSKVPESYRSAYEKADDGSYTIAEAFKPFTGAIGGLSKALGKERGVTKELRGKSGDAETAVTQALTELGFEGADLESAREELTGIRDQLKQAGKIDLDKLKKDMQAKFDKDREGLEAERDQMRGSLERYMVDSAAVTALSEAKGNSKLLMPVLRDQVELVKDGDDYVVRVKDGDGDYRGDGQGGFLTIDQLVEEMKGNKDYAIAFESDQPRGTGPSDNRRPAKKGERQQSQNREPANATDRIANGLRNRRR